MTKPEGNSKAYNVAIFLIYAIGIGANVAIVVDTMTDGKLSTNLRMEWTKFTSKLSNELAKERKIKQWEKETVFTAIQIVDEAKGNS